ncbi:MAG TPA: acyl-CoA dehydrogenase family protein [Solirubrobacterales bacterium]|nr:acyl-CoA dehydrogenase family protein [Solirubrobacterales bacterium]
MTVAAAATIDLDFVEEIRRIAVEVVGPHADAVDREARFPREAVEALREARALSAYVPSDLGGAGHSLETIAEACFELGRHCGATGMVFAMHQIQIACIVRHFEDSPWFEQYLREVVDEQRLVASITSEVGTGGDMGKSVAAVSEPVDGVAGFEKQAPTVSYGGHADAFLTTVRRAPDAEGGDQVLVLSTKEQTELAPQGTWDPLGMRGTCSPGFVATAEFPVEQILATPFSRISSESMTPISHILWSHVWLGVATDAFDRARAFVRAAAKRKPGEPLPAAIRLSELMSELSLLRAEVSLALREFCDSAEDRARLSEMATILRFNNLKIAASEQAPRVCQDALGVCGIVGYKNDTPFSVGRHLRDTMSACLMVANERIHKTDASLLLIAKEV